MINKNLFKNGEKYFSPEWLDFDREENMRKKVWLWADIAEGNAYTESSQEVADTSNPRCPKCGERSVFEEGQIDQDFQGNDIYGWWFCCYGCNLSTQAIEGRYHDE